jgi:hypothetical protein
VMKALPRIFGLLFPGRLHAVLVFIVAVEGLLVDLLAHHILGTPPDFQQQAFFPCQSRGSHPCDPCCDAISTFCWTRRHGQDIMEKLKFDKEQPYPPGGGCTYAQVFRVSPPSSESFAVPSGIRAATPHGLKEAGHE